MPKVKTNKGIKKFPYTKKGVKMAMKAKMKKRG